MRKNTETWAAARSVLKRARLSIEGAGVVQNSKCVMQQGSLNMKFSTYADTILFI
jgi:hypothetical protein